MFLNEPPPSEGRDGLYEADRADNGYVDNLTRLWAWRPDVVDAFAATRSQLQADWALTDADRAVLVVATAQARRDSYCSLAWGTQLARIVGEDAAEQLLLGRRERLEPRLAAPPRPCATPSRTAVPSTQRPLPNTFDRTRRPSADGVDLVVPRPTRYALP